mgnify:CR=1 FL=1
MTRKLSLLFAVLLISLFVTTPVLAAKSYYAERFDVLIELQEDGSAIVTETVEFRFTGDPFTFAFREVSATETDGVTFLDASMDGVNMPQGTGAGQVEVEVGDPLKVIWHFSPTSETTHEFVLRYSVEGIIRKGDADTFIWRAIPEEHEYSIEHFMLILMYPTRATLLEQPTLDWNFDSAFEEERIILTANRIAENEEVILTAHFAPNSFSTSAPHWQIEGQQRDAARTRALPVISIAGVLALVFGSLGLFTYARTNRRELATSPMSAIPTPPATIPPALIGKLTGSAHSFMGTIFDLAQRGVLEIKAEQGTWGTTNHVLIRTATNDSLHAHEQGLLDAIFKDEETQVNMSEVGLRLASKNALFDEPLTQDLIERGWLDPQRKSKRTMLLASSVIALLASLGIFVASLIGMDAVVSNLNLVTVLAVFAGISAGLFLLSLALMIYASAFSVLTPSGEEQAIRWKSFAEYLKDVSKGKEPAISPDYFERYLAYATVFGLGATWAKYFETFNGMPLPVWFHATTGSSTNFAAIVAVMSASDSTGVSAGGGGGGAGASGGGSSGAG